MGHLKKSKCRMYNEETIDSSQRVFRSSLYKIYKKYMIVIRWRFYRIALTVFSNEYLVETLRRYALVFFLNWHSLRGTSCLVEIVVIFNFLRIFSHNQTRFVVFSRDGDASFAARRSLVSEPWFIEKFSVGSGTAAFLRNTYLYVSVETALPLNGASQ